MSLLAQKVVGSSSKREVQYQHYRTITKQITQFLSRRGLSLITAPCLCAMGGLFKTLTYQRPARPESPNMNNSRPQKELFVLTLYCGLALYYSVFAYF